jgi:hypothetical protein
MLSIRVVKTLGQNSQDDLIQGMDDGPICVLQVKDGEKETRFF